MAAPGFPPSSSYAAAASLAPPLSFAAARSPSPSTSSESTASTPVGDSTAYPLHLHAHQQGHYQQQQQQHANVIAHPRLHLNTMLAVDDGDDEYYGHHLQRHHRQHNGGAERKSPSSGGDDLLSLVCNFEAYSHHFHLPLKVAAEKFGVRATAFKKRCRSIGIRHWPYRKVRSLRRSLQELDRCQEQGELNDKQHHQLANFTKELGTLMSPETYGIDPSGRIPQGHFGDSEDESDDNESCGSSTQSPRYGATFSDCNISPADGSRTFGDFSAPPPPPHMRLLRNKQEFMHGASYARSTPPIFGSELLHHPLQRLQAPKDVPGLFSKFSFGAFDPYAHSAALERAKMAATGGSSRAHAAPEDMSSQPSSGMEPVHHDLLPGAEDVRSLNEADDEFTDSAAQMDYANERFFDDVFLHISPDYGCLV